MLNLASLKLRTVLTMPLVESETRAYCNDGIVYDEVWDLWLSADDLFTGRQNVAPCFILAAVPLWQVLRFL